MGKEGVKIRRATERDYNRCIELAKSLKEWFNKEGIRSIKTDLQVNNIIVAEEKGSLVGFLCYSAGEGAVILDWIGVRKDVQRRGIGSALVKWLEKEAKRLNARGVQVKTLTEKIEYAPYEQTRKFYYKQGFKKLYEEKAYRKGWDDMIVLEKELK
jgi:N-acetylglutamate synthase-like GNAT family acetyltransferase